MSINLLKYKEQLAGAWKDVLDDKSATDWALFGYEGQTNDLKLVSKGDGGLEELVDDFNSGKIMYAFCKLIDPKTSLPKCVLINWQGEGAPIVRKGTCANHIRDVGNFFKGANLTIHARNEEEVDPQIIIDKVAKSGSAYSFNERVETENGAGPVGTTYKRVIPRQEIDSKERDKFWEKEEQEEKERQVEEMQRRHAESSKLDNERKQRELNEAALREERIQARSKNIFEQREAEKQAQVLAAASAAKSEVQNTGDDERKGRSDVLRRQRSQEAQLVISKRNFDARAVFEQNTSAGQLHQLRRSSLNQQPTASQVVSPKKVALPTWPPAEIEGADDAPPTETKSYSNGGEKPSASPVSSPISSSQAPMYGNVSNGVSSPTNASSEVTSSPSLPVYQEDTYEEIGFSQERVAPPSQVVQEVEQEWQGEAEEALDFGLQARALYDYQAADATELTFDPGDVISHIDQIDEGWWQGLGPDGTFGLFPANYVELIQ